MEHQQREPFAAWAILELMGHRRLGGFVREQEIAGAGFLRIDVPGEGEEIVASQFYAPASVYCLTPTTEEIARVVAKGNRPAPVHRWELPPAPDQRQPVDLDSGEATHLDDDGGRF